MKVSVQFFCCWVLVCGLMSAASAEQPVTRIAAASSMRFVLNDLLQVFSETGSDSNIQVVYGSSGNLFRQIVQGAPYDLFLSADDTLIEKLNDKGVIGVQVIGQGELVVYRNTGQSEASLTELLETSLLDGALDGKDFKVAIANPAHAPYGVAAKQALKSLNLWEHATPRLVVAEKVSQAAQFAKSGAVEFALISTSLAVSIDGDFSVLPNDLYKPVLHSIALLSETPAGLAFIEFLQTEQAISVLREYGFH